MRVVRVAGALLARVFLSAVFLVSGFYKIIYWKDTEKRFFTVLGDWQSYAVSSEGLQLFLSSSVVYASVILMAATFLEVIGALLLLFGIRERLGAVLLALVLIPSMVLMHHFWFTEGGAREMQIAFFLKDLAILGGLIIVMLHGGYAEAPGQKEDDAFGKMP